MACVVFRAECCGVRETDSVNVYLRIQFPLPVAVQPGPMQVPPTVFWKRLLLSLCLGMPVTGFEAWMAMLCMLLGAFVTGSEGNSVERDQLSQHPHEATRWSEETGTPIENLPLQCVPHQHRTQMWYSLTFTHISRLM